MKNYRKLLAGSLALFLAVGITGCSNTSGGGTGVANEDGLEYCVNRSACIL